MRAEESQLTIVARMKQREGGDGLRTAGGGQETQRETRQRARKEPRKIVLTVVIRSNMGSRVCYKKANPGALPYHIPSPSYSPLVNTSGVKCLYCRCRAPPSANSKRNEQKLLESNGYSDARCTYY